MAARARTLDGAKAPVHFVMPTQGIEEWDKEGQPAHDPEAQADMLDEVRMSINVPLSEVDCHINDQGFTDKVLEILDGWIADGTVKV